jgi:hypothetical protein
VLLCGQSVQAACGWHNKAGRGARTVARLADGGLRPLREGSGLCERPSSLVRAGNEEDREKSSNVVVITRPAAE